MGAYVQEKMSKLMNSKSLCEASKSCATGQAKLDKAVLKNELFPERTPAASGQSGSTPAAGATGNGAN
jgi:hypothetical protein